MNEIFSKVVAVVIILFLLRISALSAQENDFYKKQIKESLDLEMIFDFFSPELNLNKIDSVYGLSELNVNKKPLVLMGYNYKLNSLFLNYKDSLPLYSKNTISPVATAWYTNMDSFDRTSTETPTDVVANGILRPAAAFGTLNILVIAQYLMDIGVLPDEPFKPKEARKTKKLREIKSLYNID